MKKISFLLLLLSQPAFGDSPRIWLDINWFSWHSDDTYVDNGVVKEFNENNPGMFARYEIKRNLDIGAGMFKHSYGEWTPAFGFEIHTRRDRGLSIGAIVGYAPGYKETPANTILFVLPVAQAQLPGSPTIGLRAGYMPFGEVKFGTVQVTFGF